MEVLDAVFSGEIINIINSVTLWSNIQLRVDEIVRTNSNWINWKFIWSGRNRSCVELNINGVKFALKISLTERMHNETELELYIQNKYPWLIPHIYSMGIYENGQQIYYWVLQNLVEGKTWKSMWDDYTPGELQLVSLWANIAQIHNVVQDKYPGYAYLNNQGRGPHNNLDDYITDVTLEIKQKSRKIWNLTDIILIKLSQIYEKLPEKNSNDIRLLHGDIHQWNVLFNWDTSRLIDFGWTIRWWFPEEEFALMITWNPSIRENGVLKILILEYEKVTWYKINMEWVNFFLLLVGTKKWIRKWGLDWEYWYILTSIIEPIIKPYF